MKKLLSPEENPGYDPAVHEPRFRPRTDIPAEGSSLRSQTREVSGWAVFFLIASFIALVSGALFGLLGLTGVGAAIVFAQYARHLQASRDHQELMDAIRELRGR